MGKERNEPRALCIQLIVNRSGELSRLMLDEMECGSVFRLPIDQCVHLLLNFIDEVNLPFLVIYKR